MILKKVTCTLFLSIYFFSIVCFSQKNTGFSGILKYSYQNAYESIKDSIYFTNRLKSLREVGSEINTRRKGDDTFYVQKDTLLGVISDENYELPSKYYMQTNFYAKNYNLNSGSYLILSKANTERIFDDNLRSNWRDSVQLEKIIGGRKTLNFKKLKASEKIFGYECDVYKYKEKEVVEILYVSKEKLFDNSQDLSWHFENINFNGKLIVKSVSKYKGYVVTKELIEMRKGSILNFEDGLRKADHNLLLFSK